MSALDSGPYRPKAEMHACNHPRTQEQHFHGRVAGFGFRNSSCFVAVKVAGFVRKIVVEVAFERVVC